MKILKGGKKEIPISITFKKLYWINLLKWFFSCCE
jgi:hypothetical protein